MSCLAPSPAVMSVLEMTATRSEPSLIWKTFLVLPSMTSLPSGCLVVRSDIWMFTAGSQSCSLETARCTPKLPAMQVQIAAVGIFPPSPQHGGRRVAVLVDRRQKLRIKQRPADERHEPDRQHPVDATDAVGPSGCDDLNVPRQRDDPHQSLKLEGGETVV